MLTRLPFSTFWKSLSQVTLPRITGSFNCSRSKDTGKVRSRGVTGVAIIKDKQAPPEVVKLGGTTNWIIVTFLSSPLASGPCTSILFRDSNDDSGLDSSILVSTSIHTGNSVGDTVGLVVGDAVGALVGSAEGEEDGRAEVEGVIDGIKLGDTVGRLDGLIDGRSEGCVVGVAVGAARM